MRSAFGVLLAAACSFQMACSGPTPSKAPPQQVQQADPPRITQLYATAPRLAAGQQEMICYGVANAKTVWLSPPKQELSAALSRCVEVSPKQTTKYTLTAEGDGGPPATSEVTVTVGAPHAKIVEVQVSAVSVKPGDLVSVCYDVHFVTKVTIEPIHFRGGPSMHGCTTDQPTKTTTYVVTAFGLDGDQDQQPVTVTVK